MIQTSAGRRYLEYKNLLSCGQPTQSGANGKINLAICALIGANHANRVPEFVAYHLLVGFERFFIYYNADDKKWQETWHFFQPFVKAGLLDLVPFYFKSRSYMDGVQLPAYHDCLYKAKGRVKWLGFLDADEFFQISPESKFHSLAQVVKTFYDKTSITFQTYFYAFEGGNVDNFIDKCSSLPSFINHWLLNKFEGDKRPGKSIHRTETTQYINAHISVTVNERIGTVNTSDVVLAHYRYPYKQYTLDGIANGTYTKNDSFKQMFGQSVAQKLEEFGFNVENNYCFRQSGII